VDPFDESRDALTFDAKTPAVLHPPCRCWSHYLSGHAKPTDRNHEMALGLWAVGIAQNCGGVLEHPAKSKLFDAARLPKPGHSDKYGFTLYVEQAWWGCPMKKPTWLYVCHVPKHLVEPPAFRFDRANSAGLSQEARSRTPNAFAIWLCNVARLAVMPNQPA
jgi:hypothetical protein